MYNIKIKVSGVVGRTSVFIATFDACFLPQEVTIGWTRCTVREYIPSPRRCFKCNKYGHGSKTCRQELSTCVICGEREHGSHCDKTPKCNHCGEEHAVSAKDCFFKLEQECLAIQTREKCSYAEVKRKATDSLVRQSGSYAQAAAQIPSVTKRNTPMSQQLRNISGTIDIKAATPTKRNMTDNATPLIHLNKQP